MVGQRLERHGFHIGRPGRKFSSLCRPGWLAESKTGGAKYIYRADGMRVEKVEDVRLAYIEDEEESSGAYDWNTLVNKPTTRFYYDGQMCAEEDYTEDAAYGDPVYDITLYGLGARGIDYIHVIPWDDDEEVKFPLYDGHGNMIATLQRAASSPYFSIGDERGYDVWGAVRLGSGGTSQTYCANLGHVQDAESGLVYMRARYYEPWTGRFANQDVARDGMNWYAYCGNDPVNNADPTGKDAEGIWQSLMFVGAVAFFLGAAILEGKGNMAGAWACMWGGCGALTYALSWNPRTPSSLKMITQALGLANAVAGVLAAGGMLARDSRTMLIAGLTMAWELSIIVCLFDVYILPGHEVWSTEK